MECTNSALDLFAIEPVHTSIDEGRWVEVYPVSSLVDSNHSPIEFVIKGTSDCYLDLANSFLNIRAQVVKSNGNNIDADLSSQVLPENNLISTLFSDIEIGVNGTLISSAAATYPYKCYIETLLNFNDNAKSSHLAASGYYRSNVEGFDPTKCDQDEGLKLRQQSCALSKDIDLIGKINSDLHNQPKYLINMVDLRLKLIRSKDSFCLLAKPANVGEDPHPFKIKITKAVYFIRKVKINPAIMLSIEKMLLSTTVKYPIVRCLTKVYNFPQGAQNIRQENIFSGHRPSKVVVGFISSDAFNGKYEKSGLYFDHFDIGSINLVLEGQAIPSSPYTPNFENDTYTRSYMSLFHGTGTAFSNESCGIRLSEYKKGYTLFAFDLTPGMLNDSCTHPTTLGALALDVTFRKVIPCPIHVIVWGALEGCSIQFDKTRRCIIDF